MLGKHLVFFDSFPLMASSLDRLAANLPKDKFKYTSQVFHNEELINIDAEERCISI